MAKKKNSRERRKQKRDMSRAALPQESAAVKADAEETAKAGKKENKKQEPQEKLVDIYGTAVFLGFSMAFMELLFHIIRIGTGSVEILFKLVYGFSYGAIFGIIIGFFNEKARKVLMLLAMGISTFYFMAQIVYSGVFSTFLSFFGTMGVTNQALDFLDVVWGEVAREWWKFIFVLIPFIMLVSFTIRYKELFDIEKLNIKKGFFGVLFVAGVLLVNLFFMKIYSNDIYSAYNVNKDYPSVDMAVEKLGVTQAFFVDMRSGVLDKMGFGSYSDFAVVEEEKSEEKPAADEGKKEKDSSKDEKDEKEVKPEKIEYGENVLDIDLKKMIADEDNDRVKGIHEYVASETPTSKNEYTGMFEGYNVIFIVAEGFSGYVIDKDRTPTLYKLSHEGFHFNNYYTPLWYGSTSGGEFASLTGLMPKNGGYLSMAKCGQEGNDMYFTLSKQLEQKGYKNRAYHANSSTYYDRNITHPNLGYKWIADGTGFDMEKNKNGAKLWPQSDLRLIDQSFDDYKDDEHFHTYYMTVSGHVIYSNDANAMCARHKDFVEKLNYSDTTKAYIACQYELELALTELVKKLEDNGLADKTLIVLTADHVPYDNKEVVDELAGKELDNTFGWYKNNLIIWSGSMKKPVEVDKYCYSLDVLPTVSNLLGLPYDSRMLVGRDIMSDCEGMIIFNDRSFITDKYRYNAGNGNIYNADGSKLDKIDDSVKNYIDNHIKIVSNRFNMAQGIIETDYYRYIREEMEGKNDGD